VRKYRRSGFWSTLEKLERTFIRLLVLGFILVAISQVLIPAIFMSDPLARSMILNDSFEGERYSGLNQEPIENAMKTKGYAATITLSIENYSSMQKAKILVNEQPVADFQNRIVTIGVNDGDKIAIDGSFYKRSFRVKIVEASANLDKPELEQEFLVRSKKLSIGQVELEE